MSKDRRLRFKIEYLAFRLISAIAAVLPRRLALGLGGILGRFCGRLFSSRRKLSTRNMQLAMPEMTPKQVASEIGAMFTHLGILAMDILRQKRFYDEPDLSRYFEFENLESLQQAHAEGKGVLLLTGHFGNWEAGSCFLPRLGFPTAFIAKQMKNPRMNAFIKATREQGGSEMIDARHGARRILKALREQKVVCVLLDQHHRDGIVVDFFGRPAQTSTMLVQLAMKTGASVVPAFTLRTDDDRYRTSFGQPIHFSSSSDDALLKERTQLCNDIIEDAVRSKPSQWFWLHDRWRDRANAKQLPECMLTSEEAVQAQA